MKNLTCIVIFLIFCTSFGGNYAQERSFEIDFENNTFMKDGLPFQYISGSFHYFRSLPETWREKLRLMRIAGINAVDIYVQWSLHNPKDEIYNFEGIANVEEFIEIATEEDLYVILRPGPYICAEIDNGGLPYWLAHKYPNIKVRTADADYLREVKKWYDVLMPKFVKHMYGNGGNIIMVQVENEYGAFKSCDKEYLNFLRDETDSYTNNKAVLFTTDRPFDNELECGQIDGVFVTTDFGIHTADEVDANFKRLREVQPNGPLVNSEFYTGWLTHWQEPNSRRSASELAATLDYMLSIGTNVNFYMFFGGTNFGFWAGANDFGVGLYMADISSYDYDAPLSEAGDTTPKYLQLRNVISEYLPPTLIPLPDNKKKIALPSIKLTGVENFFSVAGRTHLGSTPIISEMALTFEELNQFSGFVLYETDLPKFTRDPSNLVIEKLRDRAQVYVDGKLVGVLSRENGIYSLPLTSGNGNKLQILVENQGRINFQIADDYKGMLTGAKLQVFDEILYQDLKNWTITGYAFDDFKGTETLINTGVRNYNATKKGLLLNGPVVFSGEFSIATESDREDTYWNCTGWGKGFVFINGFNLGRYWPLAGPQITMYIPRDLLKVGQNSFVVIEQQLAPLNVEVTFQNAAFFLN